MKKTFFSMFLLMGIALFASQEFKTSVSDVTVYMDRAVVNRTGSVAIREGFFEGYIRNVPNSLDMASINVEFEGKNVKLYDITYKSVFHKEVADEKVKKIQMKIEELTIAVKKLSNRNTALQNQLDALKAIKVKMVSDASKDFSASKLSVDNLSQGLSFILNKYTATLNAIEDNNNTITKHNTQINELKRELGKYTGPGKEEKRIVISGYCRKGGTYSLKARYLTYNASWYPTYKIYLQGNNDEVMMEYYGVVQQRTGENWEKVNLTFSTSVPSYGLQAPVIQPNYLQNIVPRSYKKSVRSKSMAAPTMAREQNQVQLDPIDDEYYNAQAAVVQNAYSVEYQADLKANVPTSGEAKTIYLHKQTIKGESIYKAVPRMDKKVYAQIKSMNKSLAPILAGNVSVFYGSSFVGDYSIRQVLPGEKFKLDLGPVNFFKVNFKLAKRNYTPPSMLSKKKKYEFVYTITAENLNNKSYKLVLYDRIPVSRDSKIEVEDVKISPEGYEQEEGTGVLKWEVDFPAKTKKEFTVEYRIETPKEYNIGL